MKYNYYFTAEDIVDYGEDVLDCCIPIGTEIVDDNDKVIKVNDLEPDDPGFEDALRNLKRFPCVTLL